ncbi:MAG: DEAD/DEAH box helicase [Candidatus Aenigmatarchaeota archaeon]
MLSINEKIKAGLERMGIKELTEIQKLAFRPIYEGKDVLIISPTGTGKTLAALIPIFQKWLEERPKPISILYITPMKALNRDQLEHLLFWNEQIGIEVSVRHGDTSSYERKMQAEFPNDMLILTVEALQSVLVGKKIREFLKNVKWVILDEVHEIVDSKRGVQLTLALERLKEISKDFQTIMISATIGEEEKVAEFFSNKKVEIIKVSSEKTTEIKVFYPLPEKNDEKIAEKIFSSKESAARVRFIIENIKKFKSSLIFTNTREFAEILASRIKLIEKLPISVHHSSLSKDVRIKTEKEFKEGKLKALICTSSLQLGVDIGNVEAVIQYQSPREVTQLLQRVGRSGHKFWMKSIGNIVATDEDDILESCVIARRALNSELEKINFHEKAYDVLAHQIVGLTFDFESLTIEKAYEIVKRAKPYNNLTLKEFLDVLEVLKKIGILVIDGDKIKKRRKAYEYYFSQLSTIPDVKEYKVFNIVENAFIGNLDEEFVALYGEEGSSFILKGEPYKIVSIEEDKIFVEPSKDFDAAVPAWEGELIPVPFEVAQEVGKLRERITKEDIRKDYPIDDNAFKVAKEFFEKQKKMFLPTDDKIYIEFFENKIVVHASFGNKVNEALSKLILGKSSFFARSKCDAYRIIFVLESFANEKQANEIKEIIENVNLDKLEEDLDNFLTKSDLFYLRFINVAKRFGIIERGAEITKNIGKKLAVEFFGTVVWKEVLKELKVEKIDVENLKNILENVKNGKIEVIVVPGPSPLAKLGLRKVFIEFYEEKSKDVLEAFKKRVLDTRVKLICLNCGEWKGIYTLKELPEDIHCKKCKARLLTIVKPSNLKAEKIVSKYLRKSKMSKEEEKEFKKLLARATLFMVYGKRAAIAFSVRGIGIEGAKRILAKYFRSEDEFFESLLEAQKTFLRNRKFWKI